MKMKKIKQITKRKGVFTMENIINKLNINSTSETLEELQKTTQKAIQAISLTLTYLLSLKRYKTMMYQMMI